MSEARDLYHQVFDQLNQHDQDQIRIDMLIRGTAFIQIGRDGHVNRINPDQVYNTPESNVEPTGEQDEHH